MGSHHTSTPAHSGVPLNDAGRGQALETLEPRSGLVGWLGAWLAIASCVVMGCGGGQMLCKPDPITGSEQCQTASSDPVTAVVNTGVAAGVYSQTGCTLNGCELPDECNPKTKRCETIRCRESTGCPDGYKCDLVTLLCR